MRQKEGTPMKTANRTNARNRILAKITDLLVEVGEEVLVVATNEIAIPITEEGEEAFATIKVSIPTGPKDGSGYDGYAKAEEHRAEVERKEAEAAVNAENKARKEAERKRKAEERKAAKEAKEAEK